LFEIIAQFQFLFKWAIPNGYCVHICSYLNISTLTHLPTRRTKECAFWCFADRAS